MTKTKFAIIGYGNIGKRHAQHIISHPEAQLTAVCELPGVEIDDSLPITVKRFSDVETFLQECDADVVNVCTPNYLHHPHTIAALQHQRHVVCEKPMAISSVQCQEMIDAAEKAHKTIFVVKQNRYNEPVQQVRNLIQQHQLGQIFFIQVNCFWNRNEFYYSESQWRGKKQQDGGCLFTQFSHFVDILYYLFGDIVSCKGDVAQLNHPYTEVEDNGSFIMKTKSGAMVNFNFSTCSYEKNMEGAITVLAENGTIKIGGQYLNTIEYQHIKDVVLPPIEIVAKSNDYGRYQGSMSNHNHVIENVIQTLQGKAEVMTNAQEGKKVVDIIELMYRSI
ncbi:MAG TPA: Gfo/Idh/MocA family oxidoreductase [Chitinophagaceae bacterium]|nr:Gfo/Idh/MocA family oxidoreductase [Chitinophagaceae bacterium]